MVKRSDGERKGTEKNRKWPREGYKRSREVNEIAKSKNKNEDKKKRKIKAAD